LKNKVASFSILLLPGFPWHVSPLWRHRPRPWLVVETWSCSSSPSRSGTWGSGSWPRLSDLHQQETMVTGNYGYILRVGYLAQAVLPASTGNYGYRQLRLHITGWATIMTCYRHFIPRQKVGDQAFWVSNTETTGFRFRQLEPEKSILYIWFCRILTRGVKTFQTHCMIHLKTSCELKHFWYY